MSEFAMYPQGVQSQGTMLGGPVTTQGAAASGAMSAMSTAGLVGAVFGAIQSGYGAFASMRSQQSALRFQADMAEINARLANKTADSIQYAADQQAAQIGMRAGKVAGAQRASFGARGIVGGEGSAAEEIATTNLMKEIDMLTIDANALRQAWAVKWQRINSQNQATMANMQAGAMSPTGAGLTSLLESGSQVAQSWYRNAKTDDLIAAIRGRGY